ncbi:anthranilate synthase component I family protein [Alloalcanivorax mobilis]|uniref:anthranilate synthase component I family protein n=1 Tax=Alloalcanivorax mobilis TaxID=2019569 RepID=UPI000C7886A1|nr:anthranilate synthase component I family protein [Alloalcanivorax mobilis]
MPAQPHAAFVREGSLVTLGPPDARLEAAGADALRALPGRVAAAMAQGFRFACGMIPYECGAHLHRVPAATAAARVYLYRQPPHDSALPSPGPFTLTAAFRAEQSARQYQAALARIKAYLSAGDCYQVNYAQRFSARWQGDPMAAFLRLLAAHPAPHACFMRHGDDAVFGVSPERFLRVRGRRIDSEPIKGSRPRGKDQHEDRALGEALLGHPKDRAENLMIVDLLRNDLGEFCAPGSIRAEPLFELRRFSNVQHLVSTVHGTLREGIDPLTALIRAFPGGSITGAPKKRAMQIIEELEPAPRGAYCGTFFHLDEHGNLDSNILIRTLQTDGERIHCHGGGGIVYDSNADEEYEESWFKVRKLMEALEIQC